MYETYWQLDRRPFENTSDPQFYYPGESHQGAMLKLRYAIENHQGAALLCGASGSGKSLLVGQLRQHLREKCQPLVHIVFPQMPAESLLAYLADEIAAPLDHENTGTAPPIEQTVRRLQNFITQCASDGKHALLAIDEAHLIDDTRTWEALRLLLNFSPDASAVMTLLLVGQPDLLVQFERMPAFEERIGVKCLLKPFSVDETAAYVNFRLQAAGAKTTIFEPDAMETLHQLSHGRPRQINRLCDLALLVNYAEERHSIGSEQLEAVAEELITVTPE
ncbi:MAG: AAA family ATPase [Pirellulales bacterium]|nr:AAA family ATPase [Pirellulales bacterium]